jgi:hypothetical protein
VIGLRLPSKPEAHHLEGAALIYNLCALVELWHLLCERECSGTVHICDPGMLVLLGPDQHVEDFAFGVDGAA